MNKIFCDYCLKELNPKAVLNPKRLEFGRLTFQFPLGTSHRTLGGENHIDAESVEKLLCQICIAGIWSIFDKKVKTKQKLNG